MVVDEVSDDLLTRVALALRAYDLHLEVVGPAHALLHGPDSVHELRIVDFPDERATADGLGPDVLLVGEHIPEPLAVHARGTGAWHADAAGNAYVRASGLTVDVRGRRRRRTTSRTTTSRASTPPPRNLMSARRAQVVFALLAWPVLLTAPVRQIARTAGTSVSQTHAALSMLRETGFLIPGMRRLDRRDELLDQWAAAFPQGLGRDVELGRFVGEPDVSAWVDLGHEVRLSGEAAVPTLRGTGLTLYVDELDPSALRRSRWRRAMTDPPEVPTIVLRRRFWREPGTWPDEPTEPRIAPPVLVYADLLASGDPRQREVAAELLAARA